MDAKQFKSLSHQVSAIEKQVQQLNYKIPIEKTNDEKIAELISRDDWMESLTPNSVVANVPEGKFSLGQLFVMANLFPQEGNLTTQEIMDLPKPGPTDV
jgi:hypothetical protein